MHSYGSSHKSSMLTCRLESIWDVEEKFCRRLSLWKKHYISKRGKLMLIRSILLSLPIYYMSLFVILRKVRLRFEKIQSSFPWGGETLEKKTHLVSWSIVCTYKRKEGLGVRSLSLLNQALLGKWS